MTTQNERDVAGAPWPDPGPGHRPLDVTFHGDEPQAFLNGEHGLNRLRLAYFIREADNRLVAMAWFGPGAEGMPGYAHGGAIAAVLDEALGAAIWHAGRKGAVTAKLTVDYRNVIPTGVDARVEVWIEREEGRKIHARGRILDSDNPETPYAEAEGLFIQLSEDRTRAMKAASRPR